MFSKKHSTMKTIVERISIVCLFCCLSPGSAPQYGYGFAGHDARPNREKAMVDILGPVIGARRPR